VNAIGKLSFVLFASIFLGSVPAYAQSGSRLCGWTATNSNGDTIGLLYEAKTSESSYSKQCDEAISSGETTFKKDPNLSKLQWTKIHKEQCDTLGKQFTSTSHTMADMCDYMAEKHQYNVQRLKDGSKTVYTKN